MSNARTLASLIDDTNTRIKIPSGYGLDFVNYGEEESPDNTATDVTSNKLDDYEEGTWTPTVTSGTISTANGLYTKIGRVAIVSGQIGGFSDRSSSIVLKVASLPFSVSSNVVSGSSFARYITGATTLTTFTVTSGEIRFYEVTSGNYENLAHSQLNDGVSEIYFNAIYLAS